MENNKINAQTDDSDIVRIFEEMNRKAEELNPEIHQNIQVFTDTQVAVKSFQQLILDQNTLAEVVSTNSVKN